MIEDSDRNCPRCGKRMMVEPDPNYLGCRLVHSCWTCGWAEEELRRPSLTVVQGGRTGADRLRAVRLGDG
jgi:hypothetical protein